MSEFVVKRKVKCDHPKGQPMTPYSDGTMRACIKPICPICGNRGFTYHEVDLEDALKELAANNERNKRDNLYPAYIVDAADLEANAALDCYGYDPTGDWPTVGNRGLK
jgi:hypothetical protein